MTGAWVVDCCTGAHLPRFLVISYHVAGERSVALDTVEAAKDGSGLSVRVVWVGVQKGGRECGSALRRPVVADDQGVRGIID